MDSSTFESLPILLLSAKNDTSACKIVSEIIGSEPEHEISNMRGILWRIVNKYYKASVRIVPLIDGQPLDPSWLGLIEAHLIYLSEDECEEAHGAEALSRRARAAAGARAGGVRLAAADARAEPARLRARAAAARYELVALRAEPDAEDDEDPEAFGVSRVRGALQAHVWPGLDMLAPLPRPLAEGGGSEASSDDSNDSWSSWRGAYPEPDSGRGLGTGVGVGGGGGAGDGGAAVRQEYLAEALRWLPGAIQAARAARDAPLHERMARADMALAALQAFVADDADDADDDVDVDRASAAGRTSPDSSPRRNQRSCS